MTKESATQCFSVLKHDTLCRFIWNKRNLPQQLRPGPPRAGSGPGGKIFPPPPPQEKRQANKLYVKSERLTLSCTVAWDLSERFNLYTRRIMILPRKTKTYVTEPDPRPLPERRAPVFSTGFLPLWSALAGAPATTATRLRRLVFTSMFPASQFDNSIKHSLHMHVHTHVLRQLYKLTLNPEAKNATAFGGSFSPPNYMAPLLFIT